MNTNSSLVFPPLQQPRCQRRLGACLPVLILFAWVLSIGTGFGYTSGQFLSGSNTDNNYSCVAVGPGNVFYGAWKANNPAPSYIKIATFNAGTWTQLTSITGTTVAAQLPGLDGISDWGPETMEIDASSNIHIIFGVGASAGGVNSLRGLAYGKYTSATSSWAFRRLYIFQDSNGWKNVGNGEYALKLDSSGNPHVVMKWSAAGPHIDYLKYAFFNGTVWNVTGTTNADDGVLIDSSPAGSREVSYPAIVFDSTGVLHCCYLKEQADLISGDCWYSKLVSGSWTAPANIAAVGNFYGGSMVVDSSNVVSIADISQTNYGDPSFNFRLITNASGSFQTSTVASYAVPGATYTYPSYSIMKINSAGRRVMGLPLTGYNASFDVVSAQYRLAYETSPGVWQQEVAFTDDTNHALSKGAMDLRSSDNTVMGLFAREQATPDARNLHFATGVPTGYTGGGASAPTVTTATQSSVTHNSATLGGNVTADGGASVTERGIVWHTATGPTTANNKVQNGSGTGAFSGTVNSLPVGTTVFVRAYAINSVNTSYGSEISFATSPAPAPEIAVTESVAGNIPDNTGTFSFGTTTVGTPVTKTFTVTNSGTAPLNPSGLLAPSGFVVSQDFASTTVASGGGTTTFQIQMHAVSAGPQSGSVTFTSNDADEGSYDFTISGTVNPPPAPEIAVTGNGNDIPNGDSTPSTTDHTDFGAGTVVRSFSIQNLGTADLTLSGSPKVVVGGANTLDFTVIAQPDSPVTPSLSSTFQVRFSPTGFGVRNAIISIANNDSNEAPFTFAVSGDGGSGFVVDDGGPGYSDGGLPTSATPGYQGDQRELTTGGDSTRWTFTGLTPNSPYRVSATWQTIPGADTAAIYTVYDGAVVLPICVLKEA